MGDFPPMLATALEYNDTLPQIDLHGIGSESVRENMIRSLIRQNKNSPHFEAVRIIYGRGGDTIKKQVMKILESYPNILVHEEDKSKKGSCLVIFKR